MVAAKNLAAISSCICSCYLNQIMTNKFLTLVTWCICRCYLNQIIIKWLKKQNKKKNSGFFGNIMIRMLEMFLKMCRSLRTNYKRFNQTWCLTLNFKNKKSLPAKSLMKPWLLRSCFGLRLPELDGSMREIGTLLFSLINLKITRTPPKSLL